MQCCCCCCCCCIIKYNEFGYITHTHTPMGSCTRSKRSCSGRSVPRSGRHETKNKKAVPTRVRPAKGAQTPTHLLRSLPCTCPLYYYIFYRHLAILHASDAYPGGTRSPDTVFFYIVFNHINVLYVGRRTLIGGNNLLYCETTNEKHVCVIIIF